MSKHIFWCEDCRIPLIDKDSCPLCGHKCISISSSGICNPVFLQEKKLLSFIENEDLTNSAIWYLGSSYYLIDGVKKRIQYVDYYKNNKHKDIMQLLTQDIVNDDHIINEFEYLEANSSYLRDLIYEAEQYINSVHAMYCSSGAYLPTVSFSGGKDSTVTSRIVRDALQDEKIIHFFGDTTLEFPETYNYVNESFRNDNPYTPLIPSENDKDFFKLCNVFGPPSKFERWCCTIFKTGSLNTEYQNLGANSLTFLGIRRSESKERRKYDRTQDHSKIGSQINAMPIIDWNDCDVWLYILYKGICFNNAYRWGYKRVGCWCCPNNSDWSSMLTEIYYPDLSKKMRDVIYDFATKTNKTDVEDYVDNGKWKARKGASGLEAKNVSIADTPCNLSDRARNLILSRKIGKDFLEFVKPFGTLSIDEKEDATYIKVVEKDYLDDFGQNHKGKYLFDLVITWGTPVVKVLPTKGIDMNLLISRLKCQIRKYQFCIRCSACDSICPYGAINTMGNKRYSINEQKCKQNLQRCSKCIAKFYNGCITCQVLSGNKELWTDK